MNPRGIPIAQIDSDTELDSKLQRLARTLPAGDYYAALGAYMSIVLRAWGTASRATDPDLVGLIPQDVVAALVNVHLLDEAQSIPEDVFERRIGVVLDARRKDAERKRADRTPPPSVGLRRTPGESDESSSPLLSSTPLVEVTSPAPAREEDDPVVAYYTLTTRYPKGNALAWCKRLGDTYGFAPSTAAMGAAWAESDDIGTLLSRTEDRLVASERAAELREKADEKERLRQKRTTKAIVTPGPERVGELMGDIRKALGR